MIWRDREREKESNMGESECRCGFESVLKRPMSAISTNKQELLTASPEIPLTDRGGASSVYNDTQTPNRLQPTNPVTKSMQAHFYNSLSFCESIKPVECRVGMEMFYLNRICQTMTQLEAHRSPRLSLGTQSACDPSKGPKLARGLQPIPHLDVTT